MQTARRISMKRRLKGNIFAIITAIAMVLPMMNVQQSTVSKAEETDTAYGLSNPTVDAQGVVTWDQVDFGSYPQSAYVPEKTPHNSVSGQVYTDSDGTQMMYAEWEIENEDEKMEKKQGFFKMEPIRWRVLSVDGSSAFLMADQILDRHCFNEYTWKDNNQNGKADEDEIITWKDSSLRSWLNNEFCNKAFSSEEKDAILQSEHENEGETRKEETAGVFLFPEGGVTQDKVFLLSRSEAENEKYGMPNSKVGVVSRQTTYTEYGKKDYRWSSVEYWLRAPQSYEVDDGQFTWAAEWDESVAPSVDYYNGVRPCVCIDLASTTWEKTESLSVKTIKKIYEYTFNNTEIILTHMTNGEVYLKVGDGNESDMMEGGEQCGLGRDGTFYYIDEGIMRYGMAWQYEGEYDPIKYLQELSGSSSCYRIAQDGFDVEFAEDVESLIYDENNYVIGYKDKSGREEKVLSGEEYRKWNRGELYPRNEQDIELLKSIIKQQRALGATVSEDLDSEEYSWNDLGRLRGIYWDDKGVKGTLSLEGFGGLEYFYCEKNELTYLDISKNGRLESSDCRVDGNLKDITIKDKDGQHIIKAGTQSGNDNNSKPVQDDSTNNGGTVNNQVRNEQQVTGNQYNKNQQAARQSKVTAPSRVKLKSVKNKKGKKIQISWKKINGVTGYQIQYAANKKMRKAQKVTSAKTTYTAKKLKKKKIYYVRVRAYIKNGTKKVYGKWSKIKKVKITK